jgi:hypothetical protein
MAILITTSALPHNPLYAVASVILVVSGFVAYLLKSLKLDFNPLLSTKQGKASQSLSESVQERIFKALSVSDPLSPPTVPSNLSTRGYLETLPQRAGPRPIFTGVGSPKQSTQLSPCSPADSQSPTNQLREVISDVCERHPSATYLGRSSFEPASPISLYARHRVFNETRYYGEVLNADSVDGFIHCTLHPGDVKTVIEKGWGQRHPMSTRLASWALWFQKAIGRDVSHLQPAAAAATSPIGPKASSQVLLYAPRNEQDLSVIAQVINAAVWWVGAIDARLDDEKRCYDCDCD